MSLIATLVLSPNLAGPAGGFIQSRPISGTLTIQNTGSTASIIQSISPWTTGLNGTAAATVYAEPAVTPINPTIQPGTSLMVVVNFLTPAYAAQDQGPGIDGIASTYSLGVTVYSTDPTNPVLSPIPQMVNTTSGLPIPAGGQGGAATSSPAQGQLRYDMSFSTPTLFLW